jgi:hypothetical protein
MRRDERVGDGEREEDVSLSVAMDVPQLLVANVKVGPVNLSLVSEQPVRSRVHGWPRGYGLRNSLRVFR